MCAPVPRVALQQVPPRKEGEWQDDSLGLRELERSLQRLLRAAPVAELLAGRGVENDRLGGRRRLVNRRGCPPISGSRTSSACSGCPSERCKSSGGHPHERGVAVSVADLGERDARLCNFTEAGPCLQ